MVFDMLRILYGFLFLLMYHAPVQAQLPDMLPPQKAVLARKVVLFSVDPVPNASKYVFEIQIYKSNTPKPISLLRTSEVSAWIEAEAIDFGDRITWHALAQDSRGTNLWESPEGAFSVSVAAEAPSGMPVPNQLTDGVNLSVSDPYFMLNSKGNIIWEAAKEKSMLGISAGNAGIPHTKGFAAVQSEDGTELFLYHHTPYATTRLAMPRFAGSSRRFKVFSVQQDPLGRFLLIADIWASTAAGKYFSTGAQAVFLLDAQGKWLKYWDTDLLLKPEDAACKGNMSDAFYLPESDVLYVCFKDLGRIAGIRWKTGATHTFVQGMPGPDVVIKSRNEDVYKVTPMPGNPVLKSVPLDSVPSGQPDKSMLQKRIPRFPNTAVMRQPEAMCMLPDQRLAVYGQNTDGKKSDVYGIMIMPLPNSLNFRSRNVRFIPLGEALFSENPAMNFRNTEYEKLNHAMLEVTPRNHLFLHVPKAANAIEVDTTGQIVGSVNMQRTFSPDVKELLGTLQGLYPVFFAISHYTSPEGKQLRIHNLGTTEDTYRLQDAGGRVVASVRLAPGKVENMPLSENVHSVGSARNHKLIYNIKK